MATTAEAKKALLGYGGRHALGVESRLELGWDFRLGWDWVGFVGFTLRSRPSSLSPSPNSYAIDLTTFQATIGQF